MPRQHTIIGMILAAALGCAQAQWLNYRDPKVPRTKDGKPNLAAPAPRDPNGKPDLSGIWTTDPTPLPEMKKLFGFLETFNVPGDEPLTALHKYFLNVMVDSKPEDDPLRPEFAHILKEHGDERNAANSVTTRCLPFSIPMIHGVLEPYRIVQTPGLILIATSSDPVREIFTDGRKHSPDPEPTWLGYSVGTWDKDTLVVDTIGFNDITWLDAFGHPHSEGLHVIERLLRRDLGHMDLQVTIEDTQMYTKPVTLKYTQTLTPDTDLIPFVCAENEKDRAHLPH